MKIYHKGLFFLSLFISFFIQSEIDNNVTKRINSLRKGIVPSLSPVLGGIVPPIAYFVAATFLQKNRTSFLCNCSIAGASLLGPIIGYKLYNRTAVGIKNQAKKIIAKVEDEDNLLSLNKNFFSADAADINFDLIFKNFCLNNPHPEDLKSKIKYLQYINDYFYHISQKINWLMPKLNHLQKNNDEEAECLFKNLTRHHFFIRNLRKKCVEQLEDFQNILMSHQSNQVTIDQRRVNVESEKNKIEFKKNQNKRENIRTLLEVRKVLYDWRWLISSGMVISLSKSAILRSLCMQQPLLVLILGAGIAGTLFVPPFSIHLR